MKEKIEEKNKELARKQMDTVRVIGKNTNNNNNNKYNMHRIKMNDLQNEIVSNKNIKNNNNNWIKRIAKKVKNEKMKIQIPLARIKMIKKQQS